MILDGNILTADAGKVLRRKLTGEEYGESITLGYSYYIGGVLQNPPHLDTMDDFEEVPANGQEEITDEEALQIISGNL